MAKRVGVVERTGLGLMNLFFYGCIVLFLMMLL
jgi:hypothetical protein